MKYQKEYQKFKVTYKDEMVDLNDIAENPNNTQLYDNKMNWFFYVNDPSNDFVGYDKIFKTNTQQFKFNELERRKTDLCNLINSSCSGLNTPISISALQSLNFKTLFE